MNQEELIERARNGDKESFRVLIDLEKEKLYKIAFLYTKNEEDALEILHETVYKAITSIEKLNSPYFSTWIVRILINTAIDYFKKRKQEVEYNDQLQHVADSSGWNVEDRMVLFNAIDSLKDKYKTVIILKYYKDFSNQQIADIMDCPIGTVKTYIHRSLKILKLELKEVYINE